MTRSIFLASLVAFAVGCSQDDVAPITGVPLRTVATQQLPVVAAQSDYAVVGALDKPEETVVVKVMTLRRGQLTQMNANSGSTDVSVNGDGKFSYSLTVKMPSDPGVYQVVVIDFAGNELSTADVEVR